MATINSNGTGGGDWSVGASWSGGTAPVLGDKVNILLGDTITVDSTLIEGGDDTTTAINVDGVLKASRTADSTLRVRGEIVIEDSGELDYGKSLDPIPVGFQATLQLNDSAAPALAKYGMNVKVNASFFVYGATSTTITELTADSLLGTNSVTVADVTGWEIGNTISILTTSAGSTGIQSELKTITNIVGNTVTVDTNLVYNHYTEGRVVMVSKNVVIEDYLGNQRGYITLRTGSTTVVGSREIQHLQVRNFGGSGGINKDSCITFRGNSTSQVNPYTSVGNIVCQSDTGLGVTVFASIENIEIQDYAYIGNGIKAAISPKQGSTFILTRGVSSRCSNFIESSYSQGGVGCVFNDVWMVGCSTGFLSSSAQGFVFNDCVIASSFTGFALWWGFGHTWNRGHIGYVSGNYDGSCSILASGRASALCALITKDANVNLLTLTVSATELVDPNWKVVVSNKNGDPLQQEIYGNAGALVRDNTTFKSGSASLRAEPVSLTNSLKNTWDIFAPSGQPVVVSGFLRKNTLYGSLTLPKVTLSGLGITPSEYTMADVDDEWVQFIVSGVQMTGTDGILTLTVEFQSGNVGAQAWIDQIVAPPVEAVNSGDFGYWADGVPSKLVASNFTSADDVWNKLVADVTLAGSMGELVKEIEQKTDDNQALIIGC